MIQFKVGDKLKIVRPGLGISTDGVGKVITVTALGEYQGPGYAFNDPSFSSNCLSGKYMGMCGENSFKLYERCSAGRGG